MKIAAIFLCMALPVLAQMQTPRPPSVQASSTATVSVKPDQARIQIGVVSQASTASAAASQNAAELQKALTELKAAAGPNAEVKTVSYSLNPNYTNGRAIKNYTATNIVEVTTSDLASVGKIIDAATQSGANEVRSLQFTLKDQTHARVEALSKAALQARTEAGAMAGALGLKLGRVLTLDESGVSPIRPMMAMMARAETMPTPIQEPQTIEVQATVTITIALEQ